MSISGISSADYYYHTSGKKNLATNKNENKQFAFASEVHNEKKIYREADMFLL